jgi:hypothetical protein
METQTNKKGRRAQFKKIVKEYKDATTSEIWEGVRDNFTFGFIGATIVVFIATRIFGVLLFYGKNSKSPQIRNRFG